MPITTQEDQHISLNDAAAMTLKFRQSNPLGSVVAHLFAREVIDEILAQPGCEGIRIYHGIDAGNAPVLVVTGVDGNKDDMYQGTLAEHADKCPLVCSHMNPLNS
jgi:hypothetical protein